MIPLESLEAQYLFQTLIGTVKSGVRWFTRPR